MSNDLITAAQQGNLNQVILCVENGEDPKKWNSQALSEAAIYNHLEIVKYLTPLSDVNVDCAVALRNAFLHNNVDVIDFLWDQVDHELVIKHTQFVQRPSPFQLACQYGFYNHALSLLKYPIHRDMAWRSLFYLPKVSNDPVCLTLWDKILTCVKDLGEDVAHYAVSSWHERPLPGLNILKIMAHHSSTNVKSAQRFLGSLAQNWATENHISGVFPIFDHLFDDFEGDTKQSIVAKTIAYNPLLGRALIDRCPTISFLCAAVVKQALHTDTDMLMYMISVWKKHNYSKDVFVHERLEHALLERIDDAPEKVWCIVENFKQFLTPHIAQQFIALHTDQWTAQVCAVGSPECLQEAQELFNDQTREYFNEYQNRVQNAKLSNELADCTGLTVTRKI